MSSVDGPQPLDLVSGEGVAFELRRAGAGSRLIAGLIDLIVQFIAIPRWGNEQPDWVDDWLRRLEAFYNLGSRVIKFHMAPGTMASRQTTLEHPGIQKIMREAVARKRDELDQSIQRLIEAAQAEGAA